MSCLSRWAEAYDYAVFWQCLGVYIGFDDSGGGPNVFLTDTTAAFTELPKVEVGSPVYNATTATYGVITGEAATVLQTNTATWSNGDEYRLPPMSAEERVMIETYLDIAAQDVNIALEATGACDCALSTTGRAFLRKLNIIDALIWHHCPCGMPKVSDEIRQAHALWATEMLNQLRTGAWDPCQGATGADWPAVGQIERQLTEWDEVVVQDNAYLRSL